MAKGAISKKPKAPSKHSRAARRATSPSIDTDKSLKNVQRPPDSIDNRPSILAIHHGAGVSKKQKKGQALSSKARKRQEKAQDRAVAIMERTEKKVIHSKTKSRITQKRGRVWEEINQSIPLETGKKMDLKEKNRHDEDLTNESDESEIEMDEAAQEPQEGTSNADASPAAETAMDHDDEEEIL
ncbi:Alb1-domain-containing protein [Xylaria nigripes]|nr:Alb1-domain-containing protein [Xylaria nigripes]